MKTGSSLRVRLLGGAALAAAISCAGPAFAQASSIDIKPQPLTTALYQLGVQTGQQIIFSPSLASAKMSQGTRSADNIELALNQLLEGTGLSYERTADAILIKKADADPQSGSAAGGGAEVEALIVTAQKREEDIQDVPIAISAFTQEDLTRSQIAGGPDLITQVPNMTFTKTNFSSYSVQLRGIGTQAISATTDPAVAIAFNNTPFIRNRFFEQEFYDLQRVEVLRGPQGTLYGRNATAGVVNIISQKPKFVAEAKLSGDISNFNSSRLEGMVNIPLVEDKVALRLAGAWTKRDGYATNQIDGEQIDGRDLWSTRASLRFSPTDRLDANLIWEHFEENDDRLRSGKQLCKRHVISQFVVPGENGEPDRVVDVDFYASVPDTGQQGNVISNVQSVFSQGCERTSLYSPEAFQAPNGLSLPYYLQLGAGLGLPVAHSGTGAQGGQSTPVRDPYLSTTQSRDLRVIESTVEPDYRAKADLAELQVSFDLTDTLTLQSETAYSVDVVWSKQDFNRFNTAPGAWSTTTNNGLSAVSRGILSADGFFCDPQLGCADRLVAVDISTAEARQFSQELRLSSDFEGPFNFSLGANFLRADSKDKYYVFINSVTMASLGLLGQLGHTNPYVVGETDNLDCLRNGSVPNDPDGIYGVLSCIYIDPNPIGSLNDQGHNYFLSNNPYKLISYAVFGEAYYNITDNLKVTAGLRWTVDKKEAPRVPTWILVSDSYGYPVAETIEQEWREPTGRLTIDWKPDLAFTDETMVYASYAHGYKAGGANPPGFARSYFGEQGGDLTDIAIEASATRPRTFDPEFVDAFELGSKNTLLDGTVTLNLAAFYYDYKDYQISEIVDRSAFNRNFDATVWGLELESDWRPLENLKLGLKIGYEETAIADGEQAVDLMDRTAGMPGWNVIRPFPTFASNCILPIELYLPPGRPANSPLLGLGSPNGGGPGGCELAYLAGVDPGTRQPYTDPPGNGVGWPAGTYPGFDPSQPAINNGEGFFKQLGGNELPNAPNLTATITGDYTIPLPNDWLATLHTDLHWQAESDWRIFQDHEYSKLDEYFTMNLAAIFTNEERGWNIMAYIKNVTDETAITGAFLNSDDTGLTTNVFLTEPRLYGLRVTKKWTGGAWFDGFSARSKGPYPFTVELGGQVQRHDAPYETLEAGFEDDFPDELNNFAGVQNRDLDWGDGRELKLTWRPSGGSWSVSAGVRYGRTNSDTIRDHTLINTGNVCGLPEWNPYRAAVCTPGSPYYDKYNSVESVEIWSASHVRNDEEHDLIDFAVGKDIGIGGLARSTLSAGIRFGQFDSWTTVYAGGIPDRYAKEGWILGALADVEKYQSLYHRYEFNLRSERTFEGAGPTLAWDAALALLGSDDTGRLRLDWSISGGVLFGEQQTSVEGSGEVRELRLRSPVPNNTPILISTDDLPPINFAPRSEDVTVPVAGVSLGLSYNIDRISIGAGYRWERYFDVLDGGFERSKDVDRTVDGPYFKLSVGFGGS